MITLKTLKEATAQEVFDQVANHMLTQNRKSLKGGSCRYRSGELKCAAGCLIADEEYIEEMDSGDSYWRNLINRGLVPDTVHTDLISELQNIHDYIGVAQWPIALEKLASEHGLTFKRKH